MLAQAVHAGQHFCLEHPSIFLQWINTSDYLVCLSVKNEGELLNLLNEAKSLNLKYTIFKEPDLNHSYTALVLEPSLQTKKLCQKLPLALKTDIRK